jgi:cystathionine beta-lyase
MSYNFDQVIKRSETDSYKWDGTGEEFGRQQVLPLWVADMDFACPDPVLEAIGRRCAHPVLGYTIRSETYYQAILDWLRQRHDWTVSREHLAFNPPGAIHAISSLVQLLSAPGDEIIVQTPSYKPLLDVIEKNGRRAILNPLLLQTGDYSMDFEQLASCLSPHTRLLILCSPHNPTGRVWRREELMQLAQFCADNKLLVISDEVHADLVYPGQRHIPYGSLPAPFAERSITVISPSKTFNTGGLAQCSLIIPDAAIRADFKAGLDVAQLNMDNTLAAAAMIAGYQHCGPWVDELMHYVRDNFICMQQCFQRAAPGVDCIEPQGTYLAWLDFRGTGFSHATLQQKLIEAGVGLYDGTEFGPGNEGFFRINLACPRSTLQRALELIVSVCQS